MLISSVKNETKVFFYDHPNEFYTKHFASFMITLNFKEIMFFFSYNLDRASAAKQAFLTLTCG